MELQPGYEPRRAIEVLRQLRGELSNASSGGSQGLAARDRYVSAIETAESQMQSLWIGTEWLDRLLTERYWRIRHMDSESTRPFPLICHEVTRQVAWLDELIGDLLAMSREDEASDPVGAPRLEFGEIFSQRLLDGGASPGPRTWAERANR